jgi:methionyl-tRNA formyltransferase
MPPPRVAGGSRPRAVFFGTPEFACASLRALIEITEVRLVVTQPDRPAGRGMRPQPPPVKVLAGQRGIEVVQPDSVRTAEFAQLLRDRQADVGVVVAYGKILPSAVLEAPGLGCVNVHASLLPRYRGAAPIQWSILRGENETGVCLMQMDEGMDSGPLLAVSRTPIGENETAGELSDRLSRLGADLLRAELPRFLRGELGPEPQAHAKATAAPPLRKEDAQIDWNLTALEVHNLVRGLNPRPGAYSWLNGRRVKLHRTRVADARQRYPEPGGILEAGGEAIRVACSPGVLAVEELQMEGKRRMKAAELLSGNRLVAGERFTTRSA